MNGAPGRSAKEKRKAMSSPTLKQWCFKLWVVMAGVALMFGAVGMVSGVRKRKAYSSGDSQTLPWE